MSHVNSGVCSISCEMKTREGRTHCEAGGGFCERGFCSNPDGSLRMTICTGMPDKVPDSCGRHGTSVDLPSFLACMKTFDQISSRVPELMSVYGNVFNLIPEQYKLECARKMLDGRVQNLTPDLIKSLYEGNPQMLKTVIESSFGVCIRPNETHQCTGTGQRVITPKDQVIVANVLKRIKQI